MPSKTVIKFLISGNTAALVNFGTFFVLTSIFNVYYLVSSGFAFSIAAIASFCFQKFWTFEDRSMEEVHIQLSLFVGIILINLGLNTLFVYTFVNFFSLGYFISQVIAGGLVALEAFFVFRHIIFRRPISEITSENI